MRKLIVFILLPLLLLAAGCKTGRKMTTVKPPVEPTPVIKEDPKPAEAEIVNIPVRSESFTFELPQDRVVHDPNQYFVIIGSFRFSSNANSFKSKAANQGFYPVILISERGYQRISIDSYTDEKQARARVHYIRTRFPEYKDAWLLIRK